ncbi:hypothetical protein MKZ38_005516 [Zalerion maritima]|uniref:Uncharacterized protein n=1 Tax=Zalerion maritima TaxID=339359 RepID=A0AAD5RWY2_9PEZI|nr:hypothetical protein MKZ38_005516 [Zalerion maritima]
MPGGESTPRRKSPTITHGSRKRPRRHTLSQLHQGFSHSFSGRGVPDPEDQRGCSSQPCLATAPAWLESRKPDETAESQSSLDPDTQYPDPISPDSNSTPSGLKDTDLFPSRVEDGSPAQPSDNDSTESSFPRREPSADESLVTQIQRYEQGSKHFPYNPVESIENRREGLAMVADIMEPSLVRLGDGVEIGKKNVSKIEGDLTRMVQGMRKPFIPFHGGGNRDEIQDNTLRAIDEAAHIDIMPGCYDGRLHHGAKGLENSSVEEPGVSFDKRKRARANSKIRRKTLPQTPTPSVLPLREPLSSGSQHAGRSTLLVNPGFETMILDTTCQRELMDDPIDEEWVSRRRGRGQSRGTTARAESVSTSGNCIRQDYSRFGSFYFRVGPDLSKFKIPRKVPGGIEPGSSAWSCRDGFDRDELRMTAQHNTRQARKVEGLGALPLLYHSKSFGRL